MRAAALALGALLIAAPAHAFLAGHATLGGQGAYTNQGNFDTVPNGAGGGRDYYIEKDSPPKKGTTEPDAPGQDQAQNGNHPGGHSYHNDNP